MAYFDSVNPKADFPKMERELLEHWYKDGPITANNPMDVHHAWGRTYKDLWPRFYNMRGYKQGFQNGFFAVEIYFAFFSG